MTTPTKPWEAGGSNLRSEKDVSSLSNQSSSRIPDINVKTMPAVPPPLPPRPANVSIQRPLNSNVGAAPQYYRSYPSNNNYMGGYNSYGNYGSYGAYNGLGGYGGGQYPGYMYNYQNSNDPNNRLIALAEESTRPAFESIESVVRAFGSISYMLESTLGALHASFRAALGVADHLSHLRNILSALSVFRLLQWIIRQVKQLFGVKLPDSTLGNCWGNAMKAGEQAASANTPPPVSSQWPLGVFLGVVLSGSYLAWRLLSYVIGSGAVEQILPFKAEENEPWVQGKDSSCYPAYGSYDFLAKLDQELSFRAGDRLIVAPRNHQPLDSKDWLLAAHPWTPEMEGRPKIGLVPSNYIRFLDRRNIRLQGGNPLGNAQLATSPGVHAPIPTVSPLASHPQNYPVLHTTLTAPSLQFPHPGLYPGRNLQSGMHTHSCPHSNYTNKTPTNIQPIGSQQVHSKVNNISQASVVSENNASLNNSNHVTRPLGTPIEDDKPDIKPAESKA